MQAGKPTGRQANMQATNLTDNWLAGAAAPPAPAPADPPPRPAGATSVAAGSFVEGQQRGRKSGPAEPEILLARDVVLEKPHDLSVRPALHPGAS